MADFKITTPRGEITSDGTTTCRLTWNTGFSNEWNSRFNRKQKIVDSEVLRLCSPLVPLRTGMLEKSGTLGTVIGSGEVKYVAPYARFQYYRTATTRSYDQQRGAKWFERMKASHKGDILRKAQEET